MANLMRIKEIAERKNISLVDLSANVGISVQQLHVMVRTNSTKINTLERIAQALNVSVIEFFDEETLNQRNEITTNGNGNINSIDSNVRVCGGCPTDEENDPRVLRERIRGLEAQLRNKEEIIEILKGKN